jgi:ribonucleoside-diphosphate reductase beta chain
MLEDVKDWKNKLTPEQKQFLTHIFRFFTQGDIDVAGGYVTNYLPYFKQPEVRMGQIVTWSIVDETKHTESMIKLFRTYIEENKEIWNDELKGEIYSIAEKMVELEDKFIDLAFEIGEMPNLTPQDVKQYIRYIADRRLISLGMKGIFKVKKNPLPWVEEMINAPIHGNFFENKVTDYAKGALSGTWGDVWAQES